MSHGTALCHKFSSRDNKSSCLRRLRPTHTRIHPCPASPVHASLTTSFSASEAMAPPTCQPAMEHHRYQTFYQAFGRIYRARG